jgi:hypothetical protein
MKPLSLLFLLLLLPALSFCQTINSPSVEYSDDPSTIIEKIEITPKYTAVYFKHTAAAKGGWLELNKSIYLQDANGEDRYNYVRSEGIKLRPVKDTATTDNQEFNFTVYFEKLKPGTKAINVIERATSIMDRMSGTNYFNFYNVSLEQPDTTKKNVKTGVTLYPPLSGLNSPNYESSMGSVMTSMYNAALEAQLKFYSDKARLDEMAKIEKSYYDALMKAGFTADQALKILVSKPLLSSDMTGK